MSRSLYDCCKWFLNNKFFFLLFKKFRSIFDFCTAFSLILMKKSKIGEKVFGKLGKIFFLGKSFKTLCTNHVLQDTHLAKWLTTLSDLYSPGKILLQNPLVDSCLVYSTQRKSHKFLFT